MDLETAIDADFAEASSSPGTEEAAADTTAAEVATTPEPAAAPAVPDDDTDDSAEQPAEVANLEEPEEKPAPAAATPAAAKPAKAEALPEGASEDGLVVETSKDGKNKWTFEPVRGAAVYGGYRSAKEIATGLGLETLTPDDAKAIVRDQTDFQTMHLAARGEAPSQADVFRYFIEAGHKQYRDGAVAQDPTASTAQALLMAAKEADRAVGSKIYDGIASTVRSEVITDLYAKAQAAGIDTPTGKQLFAVAQRVEQQYTGKFRKPGEVAAAPALQDQQASELRAREERVEAQERAQAQQAWKGWVDKVTADRRQATEENISRVLKPVEKQLKQFPEMASMAKVRLQDLVIEDLRADQDFTGRMKNLLDQARDAGTEQYRVGVANNMRTQYANRVRMAIDKHAPRVVGELTRTLTQASADNHAKLAQSQNKGRPTQEIGRPARPGAAIADQPNGSLDRDGLDAEIDAFFAQAV